MRVRVRVGCCGITSSPSLSSPKTLHLPISPYISLTQVIPQEAGDFDLLLVCKLQGSPGYETPSLALRLTSSVQGLCVSYEVVQPEAPVLKVLARPQPQPQSQP